MLLHYLEKFKIKNLALFVHVQRFKYDFLSCIQQISIKCHENNCKDSHYAKYQHFVFFVRSLY